jgi:hypothetical protein
LFHASIPRKNDIKETAIAAPNERAVEARRREDETGFGRAAKVAGRVLLIRDSIFEIQSRIKRSVAGKGISAANDREYSRIWAKWRGKIDAPKSIKRFVSIRVHSRLKFLPLNAV